MIGYPAELKAKISGKTFEAALTELDKKGKWLNYTLNQRIVYFADTTKLDVYHSGKVLIRFRRNNEILESVVKIKHSLLYDLKNIRKEFSNLENHILKIDGDGTTTEDVQWSMAIKFRFTNVNPAFPFFDAPAKYITPLQKKLLKKLVPKIDIKKLKFGIPIESKAYTFDTDAKEFTAITLEERRLPRLLGDKVFEVSLKTETYNDKTQKHFLKYLDELGIDVSAEEKFKTERYYRSFFNV